MIRNSAVLTAIDDLALSVVELDKEGAQQKKERLMGDTVVPNCDKQDKI